MERTPVERRSAKQLRESEVDALVARYQQSRNMREVAREFRVSRTTVAKYLAARGIGTSRRMKPTDVDRAVTLYGEGLPSSVIGQRLGFDNHTILKALREQGVQIRPAIFEL
ncbi:hypothetical protein [Humibacter ginsengiterrae]